MCYGSGFGGLIIAGRGVVVIGIGIVILVAITIDRRRSGRWLYETGVGLLLGEFRSAMQRILVQFGLSRKGTSKGSMKGNHKVGTMGPTDWWGSLDLLDFSRVFFIVKAVSKEIPKVTQGPL